MYTEQRPPALVVQSLVKLKVQQHQALLSLQEMSTRVMDIQAVDQAIIKRLLIPSSCLATSPVSGKGASRSHILLGNSTIRYCK